MRNLDSVDNGDKPLRQLKSRDLGLGLDPPSIIVCRLTFEELPHT